MVKTKAAAERVEPEIEVKPEPVVQRLFIRCDSCKGTGTLIKEGDCYLCGGKGKIEWGTIEA